MKTVLHTDDVQPFVFSYELHFVLIIFCRLAWLAAIISDY